MAKYTGHIATGQYEFLEFEIESDSPEDAVDTYKAMQKAWAGDRAGPGLPQTAWCSFIDTYVRTGKPPENGLDDWAQMNEFQKGVVNELKKCVKRTNKEN